MHPNRNLPGPPGPPRTTGVTGAHIFGTWVPPGTTVHVPVYTMHRDPAFFGDHADKYIPERWLAEERKRNPELEPFDATAFMPFSSGYGSCVGKHLALQNIKCVLRFHISSLGPDRCALSGSWWRSSFMNLKLAP
ncbi:hypothetical protein H0H81_000339 [Sphagnurus paluster]|uniref:Cytochrome P450 n=1 Tax=Sphagnurus paluster TaxID=117069 RepID=A0A9P7GQA5_9AGAR|nr:hypothetical protein H0H81_000339 [Sphagnurus paluster]